MNKKTRPGHRTESYGSDPACILLSDWADELNPTAQKLPSELVRTNARYDLYTQVVLTHVTQKTHDPDLFSK